MKRIIGNIIGVHGIKGELKVFPLFDAIQDLVDLEEVYIKEKKFQIDSMRMHKNLLLIKLKEVNDRTQAEGLKGSSLIADIELKLNQGEYFIEDLKGLKALDHSNTELGVVVDFSNLTQKLLYIKLNDSFKAKRELILPFVEDYIMEVNCDQGFIKIKLDPDLFELAL